MFMPQVQPYLTEKEYDEVGELAKKKGISRDKLVQIWIQEKLKNPV